ncbi:MAG: 2-oxoisovalerate dehydrogenase component alpha subunit, partial [Actinomycetota bacterium]|nr:2-oxoisovalerate dehydrogenase component alpha subunit [Actinomycetota bacterium]
DAEDFAQTVRDALNAEPELDPLSLFDHVYAEPTRHLEMQRAALKAELEA